MNDQDKTKAQLIQELNDLRNRLDAVESSDITSIHLSEMTAEESNERYRILTDTAFDGIVLTDKGKMIDANDAFLESFGYTYEEIVGMPVGKLVAPEDQELVLKHFKSGSMDPYEHRALHKDGTILNVEVQPSLVRYEGREVRLTAIRDITERKQVEEELSQANTIINRSPVVAFLWRNEDGWPVEYVSKNVKKLFGYTATEFLKEKVSYSKIIHAEDLERVAAEVASSSQKEGLQIFSHKPYRIITKNGKIKWVDDTTFLRRNSQGILTHYEGIVQDITGRKQAEKALAESERKYRILYKETPAMLHSIDQHGKLLSISNRWLETLGYKRDEVLGRPSTDFLTVASREYAQTVILPEYYKTGHCVDVPYQMVKKNGEIIDVLLSAISETKDKGEVVSSMAIIRDITEQKRTEEKAYRYSRILEESLNEVYLFGLDTQKFILVNNFAQKNLGYSMEELQQMTPVDLKPEFTSESFAELVAPLQNGAMQKIVFETVHKRKNGSLYNVEVHLQILRNDREDLFAAIIMDITERKQAEEALRESEQNFNAFTNQSSEGISVADLNGNYTFVNPAFCNMVGWTEEELLQMTVFDVKADHQDPSTFEKTKTVAEGIPITVTLKRKDGTEFIAEITGKNLSINGKKRVLGTVRDITERKQAEEALMVSEEKYRNLFMHSKDALLIIEDGKFVDCNPATVEMLGYSSKEEFLQVHPSKLSPPIQPDGRDSNAKADEMMEIALTKGSNRFEWDHQKADGTVFPVEVSLTTVARGDNENIIHTLWRDITEQKQSEQIQQVLLKISLSAAVADNLEELVKLVREHLGEIIDTTNFYIALYDKPTGGYTFPSYFDQYDDWGNTTQFLTGGVTDSVRISGESKIWELESLDKTPLDEEIKLYGTNAKCWLGAPLQTKEGVIGVLAVQSYDDAKAYTEKDLKLVDSVVGTIAIAIEKKQTEEALRKSEEDLRNLYENSIDGIFRTSPDDKFLFANPAMAKIFGYDSVKDILQINAADLFVNSDQREVITDVYYQYGHIKNWETELVRKDGSKIWVRGSMTAVKNETGKTKWYEGFISDISESKKLEQELLKSQKLESVGLLAGGLAHDFNNVLTTIQLQTALASLKDDVPASMMETLKAIDQSVTKAMGITQQMLTFSKGGTPVRKTTDMEALIRESVQFALSGTNVSPTFEIDADLYNSEVDHNQINQVVSNLVINARHAMPMGGDLKIVAKNVSVKRSSQKGPLKRGEYICVSIEDQGHGIESANLDKIFDPYFTTKQQGSGLGLFSCYSIIDKHDGWMTAESEIGEGSVFTFYLPKSTADIPESANNSDSQDVIKGMGNILIMDDNDSLRDSLAALLRSLGYTTSVSADGEAAIRLYSEALEAGAPFDVVILDLTVSNGLGGEETIKRLMKIDPDVKAIVSSGYSDDSVIADHKAHGFRAVLPKPYTLDMLSEVVKDTIEQA